VTNVTGARWWRHRNQTGRKIRRVADGVRTDPDGTRELYGNRLPPGLTINPVTGDHRTRRCERGTHRDGVGVRRTLTEPELHVDGLDVDPRPHWRPSQPVDVTGRLYVEPADPYAKF